MTFVMKKSFNEIIHKKVENSAGGLVSYKIITELLFILIT